MCVWQSTNPSTEGYSDQRSEGLDSDGITDRQNDRKWQRRKQNSVAKKNKKIDQTLFFSFLEKKTRFLYISYVGVESDIKKEFSYLKSGSGITSFYPTSSGLFMVCILVK